MSKPQHFDAIIIGAGQSGGPLSTALAEAGMHTALIERVHVGGTCINEGCTPTKTMVASGRVAYLAKRGEDYGVHTGSISIDMVKIRERKRKIVESFRSGSQTKIEKTENVELIFGEARFTGPKTVAIRLKQGEERELTADQIFINAGARPSRPMIEGLGAVPYLDSTSIMELDTVPKHLLVLGGGYVGLEFGQLFRRLGSRVTIVQSTGQLLSREDPDVAEEVKKILEQDGIEVVLKQKATRIGKQGEAIQLDLEGKSVTGSHLLVATGRTPNSDTLNLTAAGIATDDHGFVPTNDRLETNVPGVYALGDIKGGPAFTHISYDDFRIIRGNLIEKKTLSTRDRMVPYTVFIDPQLGRVGITETEARKQGRKIRIAKLPMSSVARALEIDETRGFMKAVVDGETNQILGAAVLGVEGGEVMSAIEVAMMAKLPYTALRDGVFAHPTLCESLNNLFMAMDATT
jgi:pyruvate/2-oxoglutarate dehydrogenase complex dihydrolipoamide dehydrogenase (E3) component